MAKQLSKAQVITAIAKNCNVKDAYVRLNSDGTATVWETIEGRNLSGKLAIAEERNNAYQATIDSLRAENSWLSEQLARAENGIT